jgi:Fe-S cluster assembly protein SufD
VKVVLKDNSDSAYTGLIRIEEKADNSQAYQENRNLLLNEGTRAESVPELEILTDQVSCTHGATVGPIDPEMVFYLKSRGYSNDEATRTVVTGFVEPTIRLLPDDLQDMFRGLVRRKLEGK